MVLCCQSFDTLSLLQREERVEGRYSWCWLQLRMGYMNTCCTSRRRQAWSALPALPAVYLPKLA